MPTKQELQVVLTARDEASRKIKGMRQQLMDVGKSVLPMLGVAAAVGAITMAAKASITATVQFQKEMANVSTLVDTSTESMEDMSREIMDMSTRLPVSINELTVALYDVRSAGISAGSAMKVLEASGRLAVAGLGTTQEAVNILTSSINVFSKQGYDADEMANILFKTVKAGKTTVRELAQSFGMVAPLAGALNVDFAELQAATAALTTTGMRASIAQSQLRAGMSNLMKPTAEMRTLMDRVGVSTANQLIKTYGLVGGLKKLRDASKGNAEMFAKAMGSIEGLNAALFLTGEGAEAVDRIFADMESGTESLTEAFEKQKEQAWAQYQMFQNRLKVVMIDVGQRVIPYLIKAMLLLMKAGEDLTTGFKVLGNRVGQWSAALAYSWASINKNEQEMQHWADTVMALDDDLVKIAEDSLKFKNELKVLEKGLEAGAAETEDFGEAMEKAGEDTESALKEVAKTIKDIRKEITDIYDDITKASDKYRKENESEEENFHESVAGMVAEAEKEIISLREERVKALAKEDAEEVANLDKKIQEQQSIIQTYQNWNLNIEDEVAEKKRVLAMNEMERLKYDYNRKKQFREIEFLQEEIERTKKIIARTKEHDQILSLIDSEKMAFINAEIEKGRTFRERLADSEAGLRVWINGAKKQYNDLANKVNNTIITPKVQAIAQIPKSFNEQLGRASSGFSQAMQQTQNYSMLPGYAPSKNIFSKFSTGFKSYQEGTDYVPKTGAYMLHKGEAVIPANKSGGVTINISGNTFWGEREVAEKLSDIIIENLRYQIKI